MFRQTTQHLEVEGIASVPTGDCTCREAQTIVMNDTIWIEKLTRAKAVTIRAGASRVIEREKARLQFSQVVAAVRAGIACRKQQVGASVVSLV